MTTTREAICQALQGLLATDSFFPAAEIDADEPGSWRAAADGLPAGLQDAAAVQDCLKVDITRDGGPEDSWELSGEFMVAYAIMAAPANRKAQRARRDQAAEKVEALIAADHTLGLGASVYAEITERENHNNAPIKATSPVCTAVIVVRVDYIAPSAAG